MHFFYEVKTGNVNYIHVKMEFYKVKSVPWKGVSFTNE